MELPTILVVDDEPDNFDVIETFLSPQDYHLHYVASGKDAIQSLKTVRPDVILLDVMMPDQDGIETCRQIKAQPEGQGIPIIMLTALNAKEDLARCLQAGADDFMSKPIHSIVLRARVHSMLRIKQHYDRLQSLIDFQRHTIDLLERNLQDLRNCFPSKLSHELNTPLNGILGGLEFLRLALERFDFHEVSEFLNITYESASRLDKLTRKFLNYSSLEMSRSPLEDRPLSQAGTILEIAQHQAQAMGRLHDLIGYLEAMDLGMTPEHLHWLVEELVENACKFSPLGTPITIRGSINAGQFLLSIHDRGRGMTQEQIDGIGPFRQFERDIYEQQGTGLGLAIAQKILAIYGGDLQIVSPDRRETTVYVTLPLAPGVDLGDRT